MMTMTVAEFEKRKTARSPPRSTLRSPRGGATAAVPMTSSSTTFKTSNVLFLVSIAIMAIFVDVTNAENCPTFKCFHNSTCTESEAKLDSIHPDGMDFHKELERDGKHCSCEAGFTGLRCGTKYETCNDGDHVCYNNGRCIKGLEDMYGNDQLFCDCSEAIDMNGDRFVGKYCEHRVLEVCNPEEGGTLFCVNGATCKNNAAQDHRDFPCQCRSIDHRGPHCEFNAGQVPHCDLECQNDGKCRLGIKNLQLAYFGYNNGWQDSVNAMYCDCPPGHFGAHCELSSIPCGDHHCFNGGQCVTVADSDDTACDCTKAGHKGASFGGQFCQYQATSYCSKNPTPGGGHAFCLNNGECRENVEEGCDCPDGWEGPICEVHKSADASSLTFYTSCDLDCNGHGQCRKGAKDLSFFQDMPGSASLTKDMKAHTTNFEHCVCEGGWFGLKCEHEVELCGIDKRESSLGSYRICLNGGKCKLNREFGKYECDCATASAKHQIGIAGTSCEHKATAICKESMDGTVSFCTNGGFCKRVTKGDDPVHEGCDCLDGYEGDHCEKVLASAANSPDAKGDGGMAKRELIAAYLGLIVIVMVGGIMYLFLEIAKRRYEFKKEHDTADPDEQPPPPNVPNTAPYPDRNGSGSGSGDDDDNNSNMMSTDGASTSSNGSNNRFTSYTPSRRDLNNSEDVPPSPTEMAADVDVSPTVSAEDELDNIEII